MKITLIGMPYLREHLATQKKCVELAPTWSKAKLRLIYCYISLDDVEEACGYISPLLLNNVNRTQDKTLLGYMKAIKYYSLTKRSAVNWQHVVFKEKCLVVDPLGAGDMTHLPKVLQSLLTITPMNIITMRRMIEGGESETRALQNLISAL